MSGATPPEGSVGYASDEQIVSEVRKISSVPTTRGPGDTEISAAVRGFVEAFDYWYIRVMRKAVSKYRNLVVGRVNPMIRRVEFETLSPNDTAFRLVSDYNNRNFVTAGGWALEALAIRICAQGQKSPTAGIDVQRYDPKTGDYHLYVIKSGPVTRNSDILAALKRHARRAEQAIRQSKSKGTVHAYYAIAAGKTTTSFEDGIHRPSSAEFWSQMTALGEQEAVALVLAMSRVAGSMVRSDASAHVQALQAVVASYISKRGAADEVDWDFLGKRNMRAKTEWQAEDVVRHKEAQALLARLGYSPETDTISDEAPESVIDDEK
jgi:hypothetical protein